MLLPLPAAPLPDVGGGHPARRDRCTSRACSARSYDGAAARRAARCVGAANALANPKRLLRAFPAALYEVGIAVVVAVTVAPQLVESVQRVRRARRLRGDAARGPAGGARRSRSRCCRTRSTARCCWPRRWTRAATADRADRPRPPRRTDRRADPRRPARRLRRRLRPARRHLAGGSACPVLLARLVLAVAGLWLGGRRGPPHHLPARPVARSPEWSTAASGAVAAAVPARAGTARPAGADDARCSRSVRPTLPLLAVAGILVGRAARRARRRPRRRSPARGAAARRPARPTVGDVVIRFDRVYGHLRRIGRPRRCATSTSTIAEGELCLVVGRTGSGKSHAARRGQRARPALHRRAAWPAGCVVDGRDTRDPPAPRARRRRRRRRPGPARRLRHRHRRGGARLRHGAARRCRPRVMRKRVEETLDLLGIADLRDAPLRDAVRRPAAAGRDRLGAHRAPAGPRARRADLGARPDRRRGGARRDHPARARPRRHRADGRAPARAGRAVRRPRRARAAPTARVARRAARRDDARPRDVAPPVVELGRLAGWDPLPLSVRDARRAAPALRAARSATSPPTAAPARPRPGRR